MSHLGTKAVASICYIWGRTPSTPSTEGQTHLLLTAMHPVADGFLVVVGKLSVPGPEIG